MKIKKLTAGFTLIEIMVVMAIVAILASVVILIINPQELLKKARDAQRKNNLQQIGDALARFNLDSGYYPFSTADFQITGAPWGQSWLPYMSKVPQDPLPNQSYTYFSNGAYYQLYAKLERSDGQNCTGCGPNSEYNYGLSSSSQTALTSITPTASPSASLTPLATLSPSPSPIHYQGELSGFISTKDNPRMIKFIISPFDPLSGEDQTIFVDAQDSSSPITSFKVTVRTDKGQNTYPLNLSSGTDTLGTWQGTWKATDSHEQVYNISLVATNQANQSSTIDIQFEGSLKNARGQ